MSPKRADFHFTRISLDDSVIAQVDSNVTSPRNHISPLAIAKPIMRKAAVIPKIVGVVAMPSSAASRIVIVGVELAHIHAASISALIYETDTINAVARPA